MLMLQTIRVMSGQQGLPISDVYDATDPDALSEMLGSFDLDAYGVQDAAELRNLLDVVEPSPTPRAAGASSCRVETSHIASICCKAHRISRGQLSALLERLYGYPIIVSVFRSV